MQFQTGVQREPAVGLCLLKVLQNENRTLARDSLKRRVWCMEMTYHQSQALLYSSIIFEHIQGGREQAVFEIPRLLHNSLNQNGRLYAQVCCSRP